MTLTGSRWKFAFPIAGVVALATSPLLALWWVLAGVVLGLVGAALIPTARRRHAPAVIATGLGLAAGGLIYVLIGMFANVL